MMSCLKPVSLHLVFKLHCPVARWSVGLHKVSVSASKKPQPKNPHIDTGQTALCLPGPWPHGSALSITPSVCLFLPMCHSLLIYSRAVVWNESTIGCLVAPGLSGFWVVDLLQAMIRGCWAQAGCPSWPGTGTSPATPICCRSHKLVERFVSCFALLPHLHFSGPHRHSPWLEANLTPCSSEKTDLRGFYSTGCIQEDNRKC